MVFEHKQRRIKLIARRHTYAIALALLVSLLGSVSADAARGGNGGKGGKGTTGNPYTALPPCVLTDFLQPPAARIWSPITGDTVPAGGTEWVAWGANSGIWVGDPTFGALLGVQLFVDDQLNSFLDLAGGTVSPLAWSSPQPGQHGLTLRAYVTDFSRTRACSVDSESQYPVVH